MKIAAKDIPWYVADFETTGINEYERTGATRVWLWSVADANGNISAQSSQRLPGNSHRLVNQARLTPSSVTPMPTPTIRVRVLPSRRGICVSHKWLQIWASMLCQDSSNTLSGSSTRAAMTKTSGYQRRWAGWATKNSRRWMGRRENKCGSGLARDANTAVSNETPAMLSRARPLPQVLLQILISSSPRGPSCGWLRPDACQPLPPEWYRP